MADSPFDAFGPVNRRQRQMSSSGGAYPDPGYIPDSAPPPQVPNAQQQLTEEGDEEGQQALVQQQKQQQADAIAQQKAQDTQAKQDTQNWQDQARVDAANAKASGIVTQEQTIPGPDGKDINVQAYQQNPDGTTAYKPEDMGVQTLPDGSAYRVNRDQWGRQNYSDPYQAGVNANVNLNKDGQIIATPKGKDANSLPKQDVTTQGITGLDAVDAQGNPDPTQLKVAPNAPINDPAIQAGINDQERKLLSGEDGTTGAAGQRVKTTLEAAKDDAAQAAADAKADHDDAQTALVNARAGLDPRTATAGQPWSLANAQAAVQAAQADADAKKQAMTNAQRDLAMKTGVFNKAKNDPLSYLQDQSDAQSQASEQAKGNLPPSSGTPPSPSGSPQPAPSPNWPSTLPPEWQSMTGAQLGAVTLAPGQQNAWAQAMNLKAQQEAQGQGGQPGAATTTGTASAQPQPGASGTPDNSDPNNLTGLIMGTYGQPPPGGLSATPNGTSPTTPSDAGVLNLNPDGSLTPAEPLATAGLLTGTYGDKSDAATTEVAPNDGAPPGQKLIAYKSLISGRTIDPNSFTGGIVEFARRVDNDLDTSVLGAVGGTVRLASAFGQSKISPAAIAERTIDGLIGTHTAQDQQDFAKKLGDAADTIDKASKVAALPVSSTNDNSTLGKSAQWTSLGLQSMLGGEGQIARALQSGGYAVQMGEAARQNALDQGATESAANQAGITTGAEMALASYVFGPFSKLLAKVPGISSASPSFARAALNTVMGFGLKAAKGGAEFGLINTGSEAANQIALEQSGVANPDAGTKIAKAGLDGLAQGAIIQGSMEGVERGSLEYNNMKVGQALKAEGGKAAIVVQTAHAFQGIDAAQQAGKLTPQQAQAARAAVVSPFTPENQAVLVAHATNASDAQAAALDVMKNAAKAAGTPVAGFEDQSNSDVHQAAARTAGVPAPDADLQHLNDDQLAAEHDEVVRTVQQHQAAQNPEPATIRLPNGRVVDNPNWSGKAPFDPGVRRMGKPDATPQYQQKVAGEIDRRQQANQAVADFASGPRPDGDAGDLHDEINRRLNAQQVSEQAKVQLNAIANKLAQQTKATEDLSQRPAGIATLRELNKYNAGLPPGTPKADATTARAATELAPPLPSGDSAPIAPHYFPIAHQIERLGNPDQQDFATAAMKLNNGRTLSSDDQKALFGDQTGQPPPQDARTGEPLTEQGPTGKPILTKAGLSRLKELVPAFKGVLPDTHQDQLDAHAKQAANLKGAVAKGKQAAADMSGQAQGKNPHFSPTVNDVRPPDPDLAHLDDETLQVQRDNIANAHATTKAASGGNVPEAARARLAKLDAELARRQAARAAQGAPAVGAPAGHKVDDSINFTHPGPDGRPVQMRGDVTEVTPKFYRVATDDGSELKVPIVQHVEGAKPDEAGGPATTGKAKAENRIIQDFRSGKVDEATARTRLGNLGLSDDAIQQRLTPGASDSGGGAPKPKVIKSPAVSPKDVQGTPAYSQRISDNRKKTEELLKSLPDGTHHIVSADGEHQYTIEVSTSKKTGRKSIVMNTPTGEIIGGVSEAAGELMHAPNAEQPGEWHEPSHIESQPGAAKAEKVTEPKNPRLVSAIEASMGGRRMELTDSLRKQKLSTYTDSSARDMTVQDGIDKGYLEEFQDGGKTYVRQAKAGGGKGEAPGPKVKASDLPGIDASTIKPEHAATASLLGSVYSKFRGAAKALGVTGFKAAAHSEGTIGLAIRPDDLTKVELDLPRLVKELAKLPTPEARQARLTEVMDEELRHIALETVAGEDNGTHSIEKADETFARLWASASDVQKKTAIDLYDKGALAFVDPAGAAKNPNNTLRNSSDANKGREYMRMISQLQARGRTSEIAELLNPQTKTFFQKVVDYLRHVFAKVNDPAAQQLLDRTEQLLRMHDAIDEPDKPPGSPADIALPNGDSIPAKYEVAELGDIQPSHRNGSPNPAYPPGLNERDYSLPAEKAKNEGMVSSFDPRRVVTDNPDAVNGPPIVDKSGIVLGGNRRTIMLSDPRAYAKYKPYLQSNAARFGINPDDVAKMHQPVLIRRVDTPIEQRPELIRRLNESPTGGLDTANDAVSAGKQVSPDLVKSVSDLFQQDLDKTPFQHLSDGDTKAIAQGLLDAGAIRPNDKEKYIAANGNLTPEGARYARSVLLGGILPDANLLREVADTPTGTKLLNGLSAVYLMRSRGVDISPLQEGVSLEADRQRRGIKSVVEHQAQGNLAGIGREPSTEGKTLQSFLAGIKGNEARRAFTQLQSLVAPLEPGQTGLFGEANRKSIADVSDAEMNQVIASSKRVTKAADALKKADPVGGAPVNYPGPLPMPGMPEGDLSPEQRAVEAKFADWVQKDPDRAARAYAGLAETEGGRVIDMDEARKLSPDYSASKHSKAVNSVSVQKVVNALATKKLLLDAGKALRTGDTMGLTAGGPGSGKGNIKRILPGEWYGAKFVYDGVLRSLPEAQKLIENAKASGARVNAWYVHVPVENAVGQAVGRAAHDGRSLPLSVLASGHFEAQHTFIDLLKHYANDPAVDLKVVDNSGTQPRVVENPLSFLQNERILYTDADEVKQRAEQAFEGNVHRLTDPDAISIFRDGKTVAQLGRGDIGLAEGGRRRLGQGTERTSASAQLGDERTREATSEFGRDHGQNVGSRERGLGQRDPSGELSESAERRGERSLRSGDQAGSPGAPEVANPLAHLPLERVQKIRDDLTKLQADGSTLNEAQKRLLQFAQSRLTGPVGGAGVHDDVPHALSADEVAKITDDWNRSPFAKAHESNVRDVYENLKRLQDEGTPLNAGQQRLFDAAHDRLGITDDGRDILGGARVQDTATRSLFDQPETPADNQTRADEAPMTRDAALRIYNQLSPRRQAGETLNAGQARLLERAEQALGQTFIPGLDETASTRTGAKTPPPQVNFGKPETGIRAELRTEGADMFGARPPGQQSLFGSGVRDLPMDLPGQRDLDIADEGAAQRPGGSLPRRVEVPLRKYVKALHQADLDLGVPGQRPLDFARQYQTDFGREPDSVLTAGAREIQKNEGIAMTPKDLFEGNLDLADRIAARFDNIPGVEPEDRKQVARLKLYQMAEGHDPNDQASFRNKAARGITNAMIDLRRKQMRLAAEQPTLDETRPGSETTTAKDNLPAREPLSSQDVARSESHALLRSEIGNLPDALRPVGEGLLDGKSPTQIAQEQGYSKQHAGNLAKVVLTKLALRFKAKGLEKADLVGGGRIDSEGLKSYLERNGVQDRQAPEAIKAALAQTDLPGFERTYDGVAPRPRTVRTVPRDADQIARAQVLRNPADAAGLRQAFATGDTISSILPKYVGGRIPTFDLRGKTVESPSDFAKLAWAFRSPYLETLKVAVLNGRNKIVHSEVLNVGTLNEALTDTPAIIRSIQQAAGKTTSRRVIISHNHPSGDPTPSDADLKATRNMETALKQAGIDLVDHVITNGKRFSSSRGGWSVQDLPEGGPSAWEAVPREDLVKVDNDKSLEPIVRALRQAGPDHTHVVYLNTKLGVTAIERAPSGQSYDALLHRISNGVAREGAAGVLIATNDLDPRRARDMQRDLSGVAKLYDVSSPDHASFVGKGLLNETPARPAIGGAGVRPPNDPRSDREARLTHEELRAEYNAEVARIKSNPVLDQQQKGVRLKAEGMRFSAKMRFATGNLTAIEAAEKAKFQASNYQGKPVSFEGREATVVGQVFGKVKLKFADGSTKNVPPEEVEHETRAVHGAGVRPPLNFDLEGQSIADARDAFDKDDVDTWPIPEEERERLRPFAADLDDNEQHSAASTLVDDMRENGWPEELVAKAEQLRDAMEERHQAGKDELDQRGDEAEDFLNDPDRQTAHDTDLDDTDTWPEDIKDKWDDLSLSDPETWPEGMEADARRDGAITEEPADEDEPDGDKDVEIDQDYAQAWMADHLVAPEVRRAIGSLPDGPDIEQQRRSSLLDNMAEKEAETRLEGSPERQALEKANNDQNDFARTLADRRGLKSAVSPYVSEGKLRAHEQGKGWTDHELTPEELAHQNALRQGFSDAWRNHRQAVERDTPGIRDQMKANPPARWDDSRVADWKRDNAPEGGQEPTAPTQGTLFGAGVKEPPTDTNRSPSEGFAVEHYRDPDPAHERHALDELPSAERARARIGEKFLGIPVHDSIKKVVRGAVDKIPLDSDIQKAAELLHNAKDQALKFIAPQVRTDAARLSGELYSHRAAEYRLMRSQAIEAVKTARAIIDRKGKNALDFTMSIAHAIENNMAHPDPEAQAIVDLFRTVNNRFRDMVRSLPNTHFRNYIVDYFPHMFADRDQAAAKKFYQRKIEGSRAFTKQRTIPTIDEAVEAGFHLKSDNAADLFLMKWDEMLRYKMGQDYLSDLRDNGVALPFDSDAAAPMGWSMIDPRIGKSTVSVPADRDTPGAYEVKNDQDTLPGLKPEKKYAQDKAIHYYAPDSVAQVLNNHLAPGLSDYAWYKGSMMLANSLNQANLGFSAFHLGFVTCDTMISKQADAMESLIRDKDPVAAAKQLALAYTPGVAPIMAYLSGDKLMRAALAPGTARYSELNDMIDAVTKGGGDFKRGEIYSNGWIQAFKQQWHKGTALGYAQAGIRFPFALIEWAAHPILGHIVPRVKLGVFMDMARRELRRLGPDASHRDTLQALQKAYASVDNRLGEFVYDNLHINQGAKHAAFLAIRSVGWDLGTARELGMGTMDGLNLGKKMLTGKATSDDFTHRLAYTLSLPMMLAAYGALATYLATGKGPQDLRDYFFPPTGELDQNGHKMRFAPPTYGKDVAGFLHQPGQTMINKLNPIWSNLFSIWQNKDFWGNQIYSPDDPHYKQGLSALGYEASAFEPFALSGYEQNRKQGAGVAKSVAPFFGLTPAASWIDKSPAEERAEELENRIHAGDVHTSEEAAKYQAYLQLRNQITKAGTDGKAITQAIQTGISNKVVAPSGVPNLVKEAQMKPLERSAASIEKNYVMKGEPVQGYQLLRSVFDKGTPEEQTMILPYVLSLWAKALRSGAPMAEMGPQPTVKGTPKQPVPEGALSAAR